MENTPRLEETLLPVLSHPPTGWDRRPRTLINCLDSGLERVDKIGLCVI